ncbi:hypothetical protein [Azospirillum palustre]
MRDPAAKMAPYLTDGAGYGNRRREGDRGMAERRPRSKHGA